MSVVSVIVKHPVLPPCAADGRSRNPLYYYYHRVIQKFICHTHIYPPPQNCVACKGVIYIIHKQLQAVIFYRTTHVHNHPHSPQNYHLKWCYTEVHMSTSCPTHLSTKLSNEAVLHTGSLLCVSFIPCKELPMFITCPTHLNTHWNCPQNHVILGGVVQSFQCS